mgnify:CR=1 FL=1
MKITLIPETPEEIEAVRSRAGGMTNGPFEEALFEACKRWCEKNQPKPGPGSVLRYNGGFGRPLRFVTADGTLMDTSGKIRNNDEGWRIGTSDRDYTLVYDHKESGPAHLLLAPVPRPAWSELAEVVGV